MKENLVTYQEQKKDVDFLPDYNSYLDNFLSINGFSLVDGIYSQKEYPMSTQEKKVQQLALEKLDNRFSLESVFSKSGFKPVEPLGIINNGGNTLFISAGVQILDSVIHEEGCFISEPIFISQPVLRTQYIDGISEGNSTSFINISTEAVNVNPQEHFNYLQNWLNIFYGFGMESSKFTFTHRAVDKTWGDKIFNGLELFIYYDGLEIGDASFNYGVAQKTRDVINFSDIGFGLERIKWVIRGGSYFDNFISKKYPESSLSSLAFANTLSLLAGSGLNPSNKEHGYRLRLFSKRFIDEVKGQYQDFDDLFLENYRYWLKWTKLPVSEIDSLEIIKKENERNFNRLLLDHLKDNYTDVGLEINIPTNILLSRLNGTSVPRDLIDKLLFNLNYKK